MAISLGALVVIGIVLLLVFVVLLCIGTGGTTALESMTKKFKKNKRTANGNPKGHDSNALHEVRVDPPQDESPRDINKEGSGDKTDEERQGNYDVPHPSLKTSNTKSANQHTDGDERRPPIGEENATDPDAEGDSNPVYQNTVVKPTPSPRPAQRKAPAAEPEKENGADDGDADIVYQNVRVG